MAGYFREWLSPETRDYAVEQYISDLGKLRPHILVGSGLSGAIIGSLVASALNLQYGYVRKESDKSHGPMVYCPRLPGENDRRERGEPTNYLIVDDCVDSGATISRIYHLFSEQYPDRVCLGAALASGDIIAPQEFYRWGAVS